MPLDNKEDNAMWAEFLYERGVTVGDVFEYPRQYDCIDTFLVCLEGQLPQVFWECTDEYPEFCDGCLSFGLPLRPEFAGYAIESYMRIGKNNGVMAGFDEWHLDGNVLELRLQFDDITISPSNRPPELEDPGATGDFNVEWLDKQFEIEEELSAAGVVFARHHFQFAPTVKVRDLYVELSKQFAPFKNKKIDLNSYWNSDKVKAFTTIMEKHKIPRMFER